MRKRVHSILLVSSLYDSFTFQEDGNLGEMLFSEYQELNLSSAPAIARVSTAAAAIEIIRQSPPDLIITMPRVGEMDVFEFGRAVKEIIPDLPVVLLAYDTRELALLEARDDHFGVDRIFVWLGDAKLFLTIIKWVEDGLNAVADAETAGVRILVLVEDSVHFYSVFLPMLYTEIMQQTQALMAEGVNRMQKLLRMRHQCSRNTGRCTVPPRRKGGRERGQRSHPLGVERHTGYAHPDDIAGGRELLRRRRAWCCLYQQGLTDTAARGASVPEGLPRLRRLPLQNARRRDSREGRRPPESPGGARVCA
jgi:CheY-like chemotaxis protein